MYIYIDTHTCTFMPGAKVMFCVG